MAAPRTKTPEDAGFKTLKGDIKAKTPRSLYFFHGEETYLRDFYLGKLRDLLLPPGAEDFNYKALDGRSCTALEVVQACDCLPMMNDRTFVLVTDLDLSKLSAGDKKDLADLFSDLPDYLCLVFLYDTVAFKAAAKGEEGGEGRDEGARALAAAIRAKGTAVEFARQKQGDLNDWIARHVKATGHEIDLRTAEYLTFYCGDLMTNLLGEIEKLGAYAKGTRITRQDIEAVAIPQPDAKTYELTDAVACKSSDKALSILEELFRMQVATPIILAALNKYFRQLYAARVALESHRDADALVSLGWSPRLHPYPAAKLMSSAQRTTAGWCLTALEKTARADLATKSGTGEDSAILTQLVLELANG